MPQTRTVTPRDTKIVPSSRNVRKTVRNIVIKTPRYISLSTVKIKRHNYGECDVLNKRAKDKENNTNERNIARISSKNLTFCR